MIHGHAHRGTEHGVTGGVNVRNVAQTVIRQAYAVYGFETATRRRDPATSGAPTARAVVPTRASDDR